MKHKLTLILLAVAILAILSPAASAQRTPPRCRVEVSRGRAWLVCPCRGVTYQCEDLRIIPRYRLR